MEEGTLVEDPPPPAAEAVLVGRTRDLELEEEPPAEVGGYRGRVPAFAWRGARFTE